ncbi:MAG: hypothetical protein HRT74_12360, partial [Flavobacteriales bacterium]|nr:hypothetical protein [Flavobacteriales bacterium]
GLEVRVPYLDSQVVSHSRALTQNELMRKGETKLPLRNIAKNWLPQEILTRPKKGFEIPLHELMRHGLKEEMEELLSHSTEEFLNIHAIKKDWEAFLQKKIDNPYAFWFVYVLLSWKLHHH